MSTTATRMTAEQYYAITTEGDRKQLVDGAIVVNEPRAVHALLQFRLAVALGAWIDGAAGRGMALMPTDIQIDEHNVYGPDLLWFAEANVPADLDSYPDRLPDLCVEIRSASTWRYDIGAKKRVYEAAGLPELWLVDDAARTILVYRRSSERSRTFDIALELGDDEELTSSQLPGFRLPLADLFRR
jgi:Uma2 family endonuclease